MDGSIGTLDPLFDAHVQPIQSWALACWEQWQDHGSMQTSLTAAYARCFPGGAPNWQQVTGPAGAVALSADRLGWHLPDAATAIADEGEKLDFSLDPPTVVAETVKRAVRRMRTKSLASSMPALPPTHPDFRVQLQGPARTVIIDFADLVSRVLSNTTKFAKNGDDVSWAPQMTGHLISAISAGQWPQVRLAATRKWTDTTLCQLCMKETGTLLHRHCCSATKPANGWPQPPKEALAVADAVGAIRKKWLTTRGILAEAAAAAHHS